MAVLIDDAMPDDEMVRLARNWDSLCLYAWRPHMYNPQLKHWLRRIVVPSLVLWGAGDRIVTPEYGRRYAALIPGARFAQIDEAGHRPELEQPRAFVGEVARFFGATGMMFIVRSTGDRPEMPGIAVKLSRDTPPIVKDAAGMSDCFCVGEAQAIAALREAGWKVVELRDGYYEDGRGGGVAIWGQGKYWEIRADPFTVTEAVRRQPGPKRRQPQPSTSRFAARFSAPKSIISQVERSFPRKRSAAPGLRLPPAGTAAEAEHVPLR